MSDARTAMEAPVRVLLVSAEPLICRGLGRVLGRAMPTEAREAEGRRMKFAGP